MRHDVFQGAVRGCDLCLCATAGARDAKQFKSNVRAHFAKIFHLQKILPWLHIRQCDIDIGQPPAV